MTHDGDSTNESAQVVPLRKKTGGKCSVCGKPVSQTYRPFCSRRCADLDLGRWLKEDYRIPTEEPPADNEAGEDDSDLR